MRPPGITKIEFEDSIFVVTKLGKDYEQSIERRGGIVKSSVTKSTNYLIYGDGEEETAKYKNALELVQEKGSDIVLLSRKTFVYLTTMHYETPGIEKIDFEDSLFVTTELDKDTNKTVKEYIESRGGIIKGSVTKSTNYLIYKEGEEETTKYKKAL
jgi:NAD-dependent DNA ligase